MKVTKTLLPTSMTQSELDTTMNNLMLNLQDFSKIACLEGRAYGVEIFNEHCEPKDVNECMRSRMIHGLISAQETSERYLGHALTERYEDKIVYSNHWIGRETLNPGISAVNVIEATDSVPGFDPQDINYWVDSGLVVEDVDHMYVEFDRDLVWNVDDIIIRDANDVKVNIDTTQTPPFSVVGSNWRIILDSPYTFGSGREGETLFAQDSHFMMVEITAPALPNSGTLKPVYPNSNQIIPCARETETVAGPLDRYWFHPWVLVDERRVSDTDIDLTAAEFYKLLQEIEFKEFYETTVNPTVTYIDTEGVYQTSTSDKVLVDIIDAPKGIVSINLSNWLKEVKPAKFLNLANVLISYKTDPTIMGFSGAEATASIAIANLVAAELPLEQCKCKFKSGFIKEAQESYGKRSINPLSGDETRNIRYGDKVGQKIYFDYIDRIPKKRKRVRV